MRNLLLIPLALSLAACGNTLSRTEAINEAAIAYCDLAERCDQIGPEGEYPNREECMVDWRSTFQDAWSVEKCEDNINPEGFDQCRTRIEVTQCDNLLDYANILLNCGSGKVCGGNTDG